MFNYNPLWQTMEQKDITQYQLIKEHGISTGTLDCLRKNRSITVYTIEKLCNILDCTSNDIIEIKKEA